jgi:hypothetical protein
MLGNGERAPEGCALMQGCEVPADAPPADLHAMKKGADDFGWYWAPWSHPGFSDNLVV